MLKADCFPYVTNELDLLFANSYVLYGYSEVKSGTRDKASNPFPTLYLTLLTAKISATTPIY